MAIHSNIRAKVTKGVFWKFSELMLTRGIGALTTIVLTWFLAPEDFGLIAMIAVFLAISNVLVDAGFNQALIRKQLTTQAVYDTAFYANITLALLIYALLFFCAPLVAEFYAEGRLIDLIRILGVSLIFNALSSVQRAVLVRDLKFKLQMKVSLPASFLSAIVAILIAHQGYGVWALVAQVLVQSVLNCMLYWALGLWRPTVRFQLTELVELFSFSGFLILEQVINILFKHMYVITIANLYSATIAGFYYFSQRIRDVLTEQLVGSVQSVTYPTLAQMQDNTERLKRGFRHVFSVTTFIVFPILLFLVALSESIFHLFLPEAWWPAVVYFQFMSISALMNPLNAINLNILKVVGRSDLIFYIGIFKKITAIAIFIFSFRYGIVAILIGQVLSSILGYLPNSFYSTKLINYTISEQANDCMPSFLLASMISLMIWWLQAVFSWAEVIELLVFGFFGIFAYVLGAWKLNIPGFELARDLVSRKVS